MKRANIRGMAVKRFLLCQGSHKSTLHLWPPVRQVNNRAQGPYIPTKYSQTTLRAQVGCLAMDAAKRLVFPSLVCLSGVCWIIFSLTYKLHHSCIEANCLVFLWRYKTLISV